MRNGRKLWIDETADNSTKNETFLSFQRGSQLRKFGAVSLLNKPAAPEITADFTKNLVRPISTVSMEV